MLRVEIWIFTTLFAFGIIGGMTYLNLTRPTGPPAPAPSHDHQRVSPLGENLAIKESDPDYVYGLLQDGDRYLMAGNYALALEQYFEYEKSVPESGSATLLRQAYCYELQNQYLRAEKVYSRAVTTAPNIHHQMLAIAGMARCLSSSEQLRDALAVLSDQALVIDQHQNVPDEILAQFLYQFGHVLMLNAPGVEMGLLSPNSAAFEDASATPEAQLKVIDETWQLTNTKLDTSNAISVRVLQRPTDSANVITVSLSAKIQPVSMLLSKLVAASDLRLFVSEKASAEIANRSKSVSLRSTQLSSFLDVLLAQFDLVWYQIDDELHVVTQQELDAGVTPGQFWYDSAQRAFRRFEVRFPDNFRRNLALLSRANLSLMQNHLDAASNQYQELAQAQPEDEILAKLFFNQAKLQMLLGKTEAANQLYFLAIDQTMDPMIESSGYCLVGANLLSSGDLETTIRTSRRGLVSAVNAGQRQSASLTLARAYLLQDDPFSANNALFNNHEFFDEPAAKNQAAILGSFARYVGVKNKAGIRNARNRLFSAIAMIPDSDYGSFADCYLAAHAFEELGFTDRAIEKYILALSHPDVGVWQRSILYELAIAQRSIGLIENATKTFHNIANSDYDRWTRLALIQLAEIYVESRQTAACIETCKQLWQAELNDEEKQTTLEILGRAFQQKGKHHSAALCFAGLLPDSF